MKKKIVGILVCMLLIATALPISANILVNSEEKKNVHETRLDDGWVKSYGGEKIEAIQNAGLKDLGDLQFMWGLEQQTSDYQTVGCGCDGTYFYITGGNNGVDPNKVYIFDFDGNYVDSFDQTGTIDWGWIDLAWDGQYFYGGRDGGIIDVFTQDGTVVSQISAPVPWPVGLAYDPATDHLWTTDRFSDTDFYEIDKDGNVVNIYSNSNLVYGLAWDDVSVGGPYLWCSVFVDGGPECTFHQFDPTAGSYTGVSFEAADPGDTVSNKACGLGFTTAWNTSVGVLFAIQQCDQTPDGPGDQLAGYEICEIGAPVPDLCCQGDLSWSDVTPGDTVTGGFTVENIGEAGSLLDWEIESYPDWGTWTFDPESGLDLTPEDGVITIDVEVVAPDEPETEFEGEVKIVNSDDPADFCIVEVALATPVNQEPTGLFGWVFLRGFVFNPREDGSTISARAINLYYLEITPTGIHKGVVRLKKVSFRNGIFIKMSEKGLLGKTVRITGFCHGGIEIQ